MACGRELLSTNVVSVLLSDASLRSADAVANVPFDLYQRHLVVAKGAIGPLTGLNLLIDTGTIPSMVDQNRPQAALAD